MVTVKWKYSIPFLIFFILSILPPSINGIAIDNDIIGEPDIECLDQEIRVWVKTRKQFAGRIYAKGKADDPDCFKDDFAQQRTKKPHFDLSLGMCGMKSLRSFDPRGMYYGITLVISFHPLFITKVDQAFHVKCFFEEANRGLTAELGVSMIPTTEVEARHGIPGCTYSIHRSSIDDLDSGRPPGAPIQFAKIGDRVLHQWHCDDQMFGVLINNCYVTDGVNKRAEVIDSRGCPVDPILITGIRYSEDLQRAYAESQVFKFADRPGIWFFCQIQMCMKKEGMCDGISPPACAGTVGSHNPSFGNNLIEDENDSSQNENEETSFTQRPRKLKKGNRKPHSEGSVDEEVEDYNGEDFNRRETYQTTKKSKKTDYEDSDFHAKPSHRGNKSNNKQRVPPGYGLSTNPDYDLHAKEPVTVFGPAINPGSESPQKVLPFGSHENESIERKGGSRSEIISTEFETDDDLATVTATAAAGAGSTITFAPSPTSATGLSDNGKSPVGGEGKDIKKDYVDYDSDVTIPPNLTDLLANLPEDINADSLQKMFRDSVADRRALLQGFDMLINKMKREKSVQKSSGSPIGTSHQKKVGRMPGEKIDTMHVTWESQRMARDLPLSTDIPSDAITEDPNGPPMIAGQLMIYDLDETPPPSTTSEQQIYANSPECAISRQGFLVLAMALGSMASVMLFVILILYLKVRRISKEDLLLYPSYDSSQKSSSQLSHDSLSSSLSSSTVSVFRQPMSRQSFHQNSSSHISQRRTA